MNWMGCLSTATNTLRMRNLDEKKFKNERELMSYVLFDGEIRKILLAWLRDLERYKTHKSSVKARQFKEIGNNEFRQRKYSKSIRSFTDSALYAPKGSEDLSIAIANRSASLFYLNRFDDCIQNIDTAIALGYPVALRHKLLLRKAKCYMNLDNYDAAMEVASQLQISLRNSTDMIEALKDEIMKKEADLPSKILKDDDIVDAIIPKELPDIIPDVVYGRNEEFPSASACIDRVYSEEKGWHVVANRGIKTGDILFVEKPMAFVLIPWPEDVPKTFCSNCCKSCRDIPIPCGGCLNTFYCGIECLNTAWSSSHCWECVGNQVNIWNEIGTVYLALKVLLTCTTTTNTNMFNQMQNLMSNFDKMSIENLIAHSIGAAMITLYLSEYTNYFKVNNLDECLARKFSENTFNAASDVSTDNEKELYVSCLLLRHILQLICNAHVVTYDYIRNQDPLGRVEWGQELIAAGIYLSASIMNHSCKMNIVTNFVNETFVVRAATDIAKGEELLNSYGVHYSVMSTKERQDRLRSQYFFTCKCDACSVLELQYFVERSNALRCPKCDDAMCVTNRLCSSRSECLNCKFTLSGNPHERLLEEANELMASAEQLLVSGRGQESVLKSSICLSIRERFLYKHHRDIIYTLQIMTQAYALEANNRMAVECQERLASIHAERYGPMFKFILPLLERAILHTRMEYVHLHSKNESVEEIVTNVRLLVERYRKILRHNYGEWSMRYRVGMKAMEKNLRLVTQGSDLSNSKDNNETTVVS